MPSRVRDAAFQLVTSRPLKTTRPSLGRYWPLNRLNSVVLPAPFGPMIDLSVEPRPSRLTGSTATWPPKRIVTSRVDRTGGASVVTYRRRRGRARRYARRENSTTPVVLCPARARQRRRQRTAMLDDDV